MNILTKIYRFFFPTKEELDRLRNLIDYGIDDGLSGEDKIGMGFKEE